MSGPGATILGCAGPVLGRDERAFFRAADPWGFILFARNVETPQQLRRLTTALREAVGREAPIFIDQEGGRVARLQPPHWRSWMPPLDHVRAAGQGARRAMWIRYRLIADELLALGIDGNCAPMADIAGAATHPFLLNRCYGDDPQQVAGLARAVSDGLLAGGVLPVLKHIPGHGRATTDSHHELPVVDVPRAQLTDRDFAPFRALADLPLVDVPRAQLTDRDFAPFRALADLPLAMTAHVVYRALDLGTPATLSKAAIRAIRDEIGFDGLLMTDDISMKALSGPLGQLSAASLAAGCDVVLHCNGDLGEMEEVVAASGWLSPDAARRAAAALARRRPPEPVDIPALEAELETLLAGPVHG